MTKALPPADCEAIRQVLYRYCRGIDRVDREALETCYWPDAHDDHGAFAADAPDFIAQVIAMVRDVPTVHMLGNILIEPGERPGTARVESYLQATHRLPRPDGSEVEWTLIGRYLDRFEQRDGEWRIFRRFLVMDHERTTPVSPPATHFPVGPRSRGGNKPDDPVYTWLYRA
jgi:hypothetical protein